MSKKDKILVAFIEDIPEIKLERLASEDRRSHIRRSKLPSGYAGSEQRNPDHAHKASTDGMAIR